MTFRPAHRWTALALLLCGFLALPALAAELPTAELPTAEAARDLETLAAAACPTQAPSEATLPAEKIFTLEEFEALLGDRPLRVCGARCGINYPGCWTSCGDAAACVSGVCIWW